MAGGPGGTARLSESHRGRHRHGECDTQHHIAALSAALLSIHWQVARQAASVELNEVGQLQELLRPGDTMLSSVPLFY